MFFKLFTFLLPWSLRRLALQKWFGFEIHPSAKIGLSWVFPKELVMKEDTIIGHFNVAVNLDYMLLEKKASIGRGNWVTGFPTKTNSDHFAHQPDRKAELLIGESSAITKNHHLDCTNILKIGKFSTIAGYNSQFLTHSINVNKNKQDSKAIFIGDYTFVGTNVVVLGGSELPSFSVLGAKSLLNKPYNEPWKLYGGVPAKMVSDVPKDAMYFSRKDGFVI